MKIGDVTGIENASASSGGEGDGEGMVNASASSGGDNVGSGALNALMSSWATGDDGIKNASCMRTSEVDTDVCSTGMSTGMSNASKSNIVSMSAGADGAN